MIFAADAGIQSHNCGARPEVCGAGGRKSPAAGILLLGCAVATTPGGALQRVEPGAALAADLAAASPAHRSRIQARNGLWYDALDTVSDLEREEPGEDLRADRTALLRAVGLEPIDP